MNTSVKLLTVLVAASFVVGAAPIPQVTVLEATADYRVTPHAGGKTRVPANPQRVVTLFSHLSDGLLALGLKPVGNISTPDHEAMLATQPDLILGDPFHAELYPQLSRVAPTVLIPDTVFSLEQTLVDLGAILGAEEEAAARLAEYERRIAEARADLGAATRGDSAVVLSALPDGYWRYGSESGPTKILYDQLGFRPDPLLGSGEASLASSLERPPELTAEHIFLSEDDPERAREPTESALFARIPAVKAGRVYTVDRDLRLLNHRRTLGAELILEGVLEFVTDVP